MKQLISTIQMSSIVSGQKGMPMPPQTTLCATQAFTKHHRPYTMQLSYPLQNGNVFHYNSFTSWRVRAESASNWLAGWESCKLLDERSHALLVGQSCLESSVHVLVKASLSSPYFTVTPWRQPETHSTISPVSPYCFSEPRNCSVQTGNS